MQSKKRKGKTKKGKKRRYSSSASSDIELVKEIKKVKKSKNKKKKSKKKRRKSDARDGSSVEEVDLSLSSPDLSPQTFKKKDKKRSRDRHRSSSKKRDKDKKARKKSQSLDLDPTDLRFSLKTSAVKTIAKALSNLGESEASAVRKRSKRSVEVSNENHDGRDESSSIFHMTKSVRRVERVVEIERQSSSKSFDRTSALEGWRSRKESWKKHDKSGD